MAQGQEMDALQMRRDRGRYSARGLLLTIVVLTAFLLLVGFRAYNFQKDSQAMTTLTENNYQKDFHDLAQHMDEITGQLAQVLSSASREQLSLSLSSLWRQTFAAQANLGGLPLALIQLNQTEKFLGDTSDSVYFLLWRTAREANTLTKTEQDYVMELYNRSQALSSSLEEISYQIIKEDIHLVDLQNGLWNGDEMKDNTVIDGLGMLETELEDYPELNLTKDFSQLAGREKGSSGPPNVQDKALPLEEGPSVVESADAAANSPTNPVKKTITQTEAIDNAQDFWLGTSSTGFNGRVVYGSSGDLPTYGVELFKIGQKDATAVANVDVAKADGKVVWAMSAPSLVEGDEESIAVLSQSTNSQETASRLNQGSNLCQRFLKERSFPTMEMTYQQVDEGYGVYTFVPLQEGVRLYPDQIKMQVELTSMQISGYEGTPYYRQHKERSLPEVKVTDDQIRELLSPYLTVDEIRLALIENDWQQEIQAWEVRAHMGKEQFALFYDTEFAVEEKILRLTPQAQHMAVS